MSERAVQITVSHRSGHCFQEPPTAPRLLLSEVHIWDFPTVISNSETATCRELLSEDENARAARFHFEKDARRFVVARACMRSILACYTQVAPRDLRFFYSQHGKPGLENVKGDFRFNLSHSRDRAILGVTLGHEVGVDVEAIRATVEFDKLAERFFSSEERLRLLSLPAEKKAAAFFRCWTCKEAFLKAQSIGLSRSLDSFVVDFSSGAARLTATRPDPGEAERWSLFEFETAPGYAAAAAVEGIAHALLVSRYA